MSADIPQEWVEKGERATLPFFVDSDRAVVARAVLAAVADDVWPCDNYKPPLTCLTAPCARGSECDFCRAQAEAVRRVVAEWARQDVRNVREYGEHGTPYYNGAAHLAARIARSLASPTDRDD